MFRLEAYTAADVEAAEKLLSDAVIHALQVVCNQVADTIGQIVTAAAGEPTPEQIAKAMVDAAPGGPPGQPYVSVDDLSAIVTQWKGQITNLIVPLEGQIYHDAAGKLHAEMVDLVGPQVPSIGSEMAESYLAGAAARWEFMGNEVWETARTQLLDGFQQGDSIPKLAARVRSAAGLSQRRALAVARTEVVAASNAGSFATAQVSGLEMSKVWLATEDERTRPTHRTADGQVRPLAEPFTVGISSLQFPGDPSGVPEETRNCRCTLTYEIPDAAVPAEPEPNPLVDLFQATQTELSAAQARQADIDRTIPNSQALIDIDSAFESIIANTDGMKFNINGHLQPGVLEDLIDVINASVEQGGIAEDIAKAWGDVGDATHIAEIVEIRTAIFKLEKAHNLSRVDGATVTEWTKYDPAKHHLIGEAEPGELVQVTRIGHVYTRDGEQILLSKAEVAPIPKAPPTVKPPARATATEPAELSPDLPEELLQRHRDYQVRVVGARKDQNALASPPLTLRQPGNLSNAEVDSLQSYGGLGYMEINDGLRNATGAIERVAGLARQDIRNIDAAMARSALDADIITHRGFNGAREVLGPAWDDADMTGAEWIDHGYSSTTTDLAVADGFAYGYGTATDSVMMRILTPRGVNAIQITDEDGESEVLLQRGLRFRVVADHGPAQPGQLRRLDVEVIP